MPLDCVTARGRVAESQQHRIVERCAAVWQMVALETPNGRPAAVDAVFGVGGVIACVAEVKWRPQLADVASLRRFGSYLVTWDKLVEARKVALALQVPFRLIVGLQDGTICWWPGTDAAGNWTMHGRRKHTSTQATINGGEIVRENAYITLRAMQVIEAVPVTTRELQVNEIRW